MALTKIYNIKGIPSIISEGFEFNLESEVIIQKALLIKVAHVRGTKETLIASVVFADNNSSDFSKTEDFSFLLDLEGPNPIKQAYLHLKSLPEFADATDC